MALARGMDGYEAVDLGLDDGRVQGRGRRQLLRGQSCFFGTLRTVFFSRYDTIVP